MDKEPAVTVRTMMGARQLELALKCLGSMKSVVRHPIRFAIHDDGSLDPEARFRLEERLGGCTFVDRASAGEQVADRLRKHPRCAKFRNEHLFGLKLFDVPLLAETRVIYCDTDILFARPIKCPAYFRGGCHSFVAMRDLKESYSVRIAQWPILRKRGIRLASRVCAGMISFDPAAHDLDFIEWLLGVDEETQLFGGFPFWAEQTIYAALAAKAGCSWIQPEECLVAHRTNFPTACDAAIIHFAGFSRALFPSLYDTLKLAEDSREPISLGTKPAPDCNLLRRLESAFRTRFLLREEPAHLRKK
ncbi:MAG TPA: hypothetical protein VF593_13335 [Chthoniobacteraceae bacterium]|jgi:hypothetical protein